MRYNINVIGRNGAGKSFFIKQMDLKDGVIKYNNSVFIFYKENQNIEKFHALVLIINSSDDITEIHRSKNTMLSYYIQNDIPVCIIHQIRDRVNMSFKDRNREMSLNAIKHSLMYEVDYSNKLETISKQNKLFDWLSKLNSL